MSFSLTHPPVFLLLAVLVLATSTEGTSLALGGFHSCALLMGGAIKCWGSNVNGQLGNGTTTQSSTPVDVFRISTATSIALGDSHSCALLTGGAIKCWGDNGYGQLGDGTSTDSTAPVYVADRTTLDSNAVTSAATSFSPVTLLFFSFALNALFA